MQKWDTAENAPLWVSELTPMMQKSEGSRTKATRVKPYLGTAILWQRRIWSSPAFPKGKKDRGIILILESTIC